MKQSIHVALSIDVTIIRKELNQQDRLSGGQRALLLEALIRSRSQFLTELQSALAEKYDVKYSMRIGLPGLPDLHVSPGDVTFGAT